MSKNWPLPDQFRIRLTMESDWHVGSGMGRPGNIDRLIARDADDLPFVPAKTLRGIWRDACERLALGLDEAQTGAWSKLVNHLFGSQPALGDKDPTERHSDPAEVPLESAIQIRSATLPTSLREKLTGDKNRRLRQFLTFVKPGVKIDRRSGSAQTDMLRFEEVARKGTVLEAECQLHLKDAATREMASALLLASTKLVERLGGKRRRGSGRCRLEILDGDTDKAIQFLERNASPSEWKSVPESNASSDMTQVVNATDSWLSVPLVLHLQGPLSISYRTTGNVVETLDFVPGSFLLPHVTRTLSGMGLDVRSALQAGDMCLLSAYLEVDGERGQPVPIALFAPKEGKGLEEPTEVVNRLLQTEPSDNKQLKQLREGYISSRCNKAHKPPTTVRTHNTVEDDSQRPTENVGGVYSYEAISPSDHGSPVVLRSELRIRKSLADRLAQKQAHWWQKLKGEVALGRSKKDDYGSVRLDVEAAQEWKPCPISSGNELFVWLVSDTLLRNSRLQTEPTAACLGEELSRRLGVTLKLRESTAGQLDELVRLRRLDTWHVGWGLPRPSLVALQAGSCMVFHIVEGTLDVAKLTQLEASGVGERTAEGYGQVRFNHPLLTQPLTKKEANSQSSVSKPVTTGTKTIASGDSAFAFARLLERECWKQEIRRACLTIAQERRKELLGWDHKKGSPPMSQLGGLRGQLSGLRDDNSLTVILGWLVHLATNRRRSERWLGKIAVEPQILQKWLSDRNLTKPNSLIWPVKNSAWGSLSAVDRIGTILTDNQWIWNELNPSSWPTLTEGAATQLRQELWAFAVRTFFDACIRAYKRELESQSTQEVKRGA